MKRRCTSSTWGRTLSQWVCVHLDTFWRPGVESCCLCERLTNDLLTQVPDVHPVREGTLDLITDDTSTDRKSIDRDARVHPRRNRSSCGKLNCVQHSHLLSRSTLGSEFARLQSWRNLMAPRRTQCSLLWSLFSSDHHHHHHL